MEIAIEEVLQENRHARSAYYFRYFLNKTVLYFFKEKSLSNSKYFCCEVEFIVEKF